MDSVNTKRYINPTFPHLLHGADYNPEQWKDAPEILQEDMRLMRLAEMNEMTVGVFSWAELEKEEGVFDFSFLDDTFDRVEAAGGKLILATPSGARPRWLAQKYPEVLRVNRDGNRAHYGFRHNHCLTSPVYREKVALIDRKLAERYGKRKSLYAWHISNELSGDCYCPLCRQAFIEWCKRTYHNDISELNHAWWTSFWSHRYNDFSQIEPPYADGDLGVCSGLTLSWRRFVTDQTVSFIENEMIPLRQLTPDIPVTTNFMGTFDGLNYSKIAKSLDFISWDSYPEWGVPGGEINEPLAAAFAHEECRSYKHKPFLMMESTPSVVNWRSVCKRKAPGFHLASAVQAVAHGSDSVQYFQFRQGRGGMEKMHGAVVDHFGGPTRTFSEVQQVGHTLRQIDEVCGTESHAEVAVIYDRENAWALQCLDGLQQDKKYLQTVQSYYLPLWKRGITTDIIDRTADLSAYKLVIAPMLYMTDDATADRLDAFVRNGGTLVGTYCTGVVNENDLCHLGGCPGGKLLELFSVRAEECDALYPQERVGVSLGEDVYSAADIVETVWPWKARAIAHYSTGYYEGNAACTVNDIGLGHAYYMAFRDADGSFIEALMRRILAEVGIMPAMPDVTLPEGVVIHERHDDTYRYFFVQCFRTQGAKITLPHPYYDLVSRTYTAALRFLSPGAIVLRERK